MGLVPTMGNLHEGHASLIRRARAETGFVVTTIFVNPIQFGPAEDFNRYPRTPEADREICQNEGSDVVFAPSVETMYPRPIQTTVQVKGLDEPLCGAQRPGHFTGVSTVVAKLFNLVGADVAYFGRKDYQQARVIQTMVEDLNFPLQVRVCPIVREADGLAMSSRNVYLSADERSQAAVLRRSLDLAEKLVRGGQRDPNLIRQAMIEMISSQPLAQVDYVELVDTNTLRPLERMDRPALAAVAVRFTGARLIDNTILVP